MKLWNQRDALSTALIVRESYYAWYINLAQSHLKLHEEVTASQKQTDEKLRILIDIVGLDRNGANN